MVSSLWSMCRGRTQSPSIAVVPIASDCDDRTMHSEPNPSPALPPRPSRKLLPPRASGLFWKHARKIVVLVIGSTIVLVGIAGLILPIMPGWLIIFPGLALLATEFAWARWILKRARQQYEQVKDATVATWNAATESKSPQPGTKSESTSQP
jgi:hypothetical protein